MVAVEEHSGYSRASAYQYMKLFRDLEPLGSAVDGMSLGVAHVYKLLPTALQTDPALISAAKRMKPKEFREKISREHPQAHVEVQEDICLKLDESLAKVFHETVDLMRIEEGNPD